ncbi:RluA Pseudouridylate synthases, 23S RNA-specific [Burkholderiaceae bacterium]
MGHDAPHFTPVVMNHALSPALPPTGGVDPAAIALADGVGVLWQDLHMALVLKPSGMLSVPGRGPDKQDCLSARLAQAGLPSMVVHRLDQATSGLMLFARSAEMQRQLSHAFAQRQVNKQYLACVAGHWPPSDVWQLIDAPIAADWPRRPLRIVAVNGQSSQTLWRSLGPCMGQTTDGNSAGTWLALRPLSGRTHQLRVHLQHIGHPIWGDAMYAPPDVRACAPRLMLHAQRLAFTHPATGQDLAFEHTPVGWLNPDMLLRAQDMPW